MKLHVDKVKEVLGNLENTYRDLVHLGCIKATQHIHEAINVIKFLSGVAYEGRKTEVDKPDYII